jgi:type VI secretion system secreted protein VgrG
MDRAELFIEEAALIVVRVRGDEALNERFRYDVTCEASESTPPARSLIGRSATLILRDRFGSERRVRGIVAMARRMFFDTGDAVLELRIVPAVATLAQGADHRSFVDATFASIVTQIFAEAAVELRVDVEPLPPAASTAQFDESDFAFFERLAEEAGWSYWFDHDAGSVLAVTGDSRSAPYLEGTRELSVHEDAMDVHSHESVTSVGRVVGAVAGTIAVVAADRDAPSERRHSGRAGDGKVEQVIFAGSAHGRVDVEALSTRRNEARNHRRQVVEAETTSIRPYPGRTIDLVGGEVDGSWLVLEARVEIDQRRTGTTAALPTTQSMRLVLVPRETPVRLSKGLRAPRQPGVQIAEVLGPKGHDVGVGADGRVQAKLRWDRSAQQDGTAVRVAQRATADSFAIPRSGFHVLTMAERGGLDEPTSLGRLFDAEHPPPYPLPADKTRTVYKTATTPGDGTTNEIAFEGAAGRELLMVHASGDMRSASNGQDVEVVRGDATRQIGRNAETAVGADDTLGIEGDSATTIAGNQRIEIHGDHGTDVDGTRHEAVGAARSVHAGKSHTTSVAGKRSLRVGAASIEATLGPHATESQSNASVIVGGVKVQVSAGAISESATLGSALVVGGARLDIAAGSIGVDAKGALREQVGGATILKANKGFSWKTHGYTSLAAGAARLEAPDVTIEATSRILLVCGSSSIRVDAEGVEIRGTAIDADGASWVAEGKSVTNWRGA